MELPSKNLTVPLLLLDTTGQHTNGPELQMGYYWLWSC